MIKKKTAPFQYGSERIRPLQKTLDSELLYPIASRIKGSYTGSINYKYNNL